MSIPIKAQIFGIGMSDGNCVDWDGILILCDGKSFGNPNYGYSYYGLREDGMHALSRSYTGQVIKESLKLYSADYHNLRYQANLVMKRDDDVERAEEIREDAQLIKDMCIDPLMKFWIRFKALRPVKQNKPDTRKSTQSDTRNTVKNIGCTMRDVIGDTKFPPERSRRSKCPHL